MNNIAVKSICIRQIIFNESKEVKMRVGKMRGGKMRGGEER